MFGFQPSHRRPRYSPGLLDDFDDYGPFGHISPQYSQSRFVDPEQQELLRRQQAQQQHSQRMRQELERQRAAALQQQQQQQQHAQSQPRDTSLRRNLFAEAERIKAERAESERRAAEEKARLEEEKANQDAAEKAAREAEERKKWLEWASQPEVQDKSARQIQQLWRGYDVRRAHMISRLRELRKVEAMLESYRPNVDAMLARLEGPEAPTPTRAINRELLGLEEELTRALLSLDTIPSGRSPIVRDYRKSLVVVATNMLERIDPVKRNMALQLRELEAAAASHAVAAAQQAAAEAANAALAAAEAAASLKPARAAPHHFSTIAREHPVMDVVPAETDDAVRAMESSSPAAELLAEPVTSADSMAVEPETLTLPELRKSEEDSLQQDGANAGDDLSGWHVVPPMEVEARTPSQSRAAATSPAPMSPAVSGAQPPAAAGIPAPATVSQVLSLDSVRLLLAQKDAVIRNLESSVMNAMAQKDAYIQQLESRVRDLESRLTVREH